MITTKKTFIWPAFSWLIALALMAPVLVMLIGGIDASPALFGHLWKTVLPTYVENTLLLGTYVVLLSMVFGTVSAALIVFTNIKGKRFLRWLLMLPLAMPAYIIAYIYTDLFDYAGPVQRFLRETFQWQSPSDYWFFDIRTLFGASVMIALVLFPYVYLLARTAFEQQDPNVIRSGRLLGLSARQCIIKISIPLARPAIAVAASLVLMETLADFATVQYFSVNTLTTAIYDTWLGYGDLPAANLLASILMLMILFVVVAEQKARANQRHQSNQPNAQIAPIILRPMTQLLAQCFCWGLVIAGFLLPVALLLVMIVEYIDYANWQQLIESGINSLQLALYCATLTCVLSLLLAFYKRFTASKNAVWPQRISGLGYAVPGTVLAMAMLATFGPVDHFINDTVEAMGFTGPGLLLSGTIFAVIFAYIVRFSAIANGTIESGLEQIPRSIDLAPLSLGVSKLKRLVKVHIPMLKSSIFVAWLLVFVEAMKELPAVLVLRPFNFETLSTQVYQLIADEKLEQGAFGAVMIVVFGLIPVIWLNTRKE